MASGIAAYNYAVRLNWQAPTSALIPALERILELPGRKFYTVAVTIWRAALLVYSAIDVRFLESAKKQQRFALSLTDAEVSDGVKSFKQFPGLVESLTSRKAIVRYQIHSVERTLASLTAMGEHVYWPSPDDTRKEIDRIAAPGLCDSIFVLWPQRNLFDGSLVPSAGWGLGMAACSWSNGATYAVVGNAESSVWQIPIVGEVWLHEWLHGVCAYFRDLGYRMPDGDADGGARHGYVQSQASGWTEYYRDLMSGNVRDEGAKTGIPLDAWRLPPCSARLAG
jgi:hypothetical protein